MQNYLKEVNSSMEYKQPVVVRELYAEILRLIAAFIVVFQHTVTSAWYFVPVDTLDFFTLNFLNSLSRFGVAIFIMISGAFMLSPKYPHTPRKILTHNLPKIIILLVSWGIIYELLDVTLQSGNWQNYLASPLTLFTDPPTHLWFLYTIAGLYIITPALRVFTLHASERMVLYVIILFFMFGLMLPTVNHLLLKLAGITIYKNIGIRGFTGFAGFYLTGFYLTHYEVKRIARHALYGLALISWFISFFYSTYFSLAKDVPNEYFFGNFRPMTFIIAAAIFCYFRAKFRDRKISNGENANKREKLLINVSKCMLGVYLIHPMFIKTFYGFHLSLLEPHPIITVPIMAVIFFTLSFAIIYLFRLIPVIRKIL